MSRPPEAICETCPYWNAINKLDGYCRRHAPTPGDQQWAKWPMTDGMWWCGEHPAFAAVRSATPKGAQDEQ